MDDDRQGGRICGGEDLYPGLDPFVRPYQVGDRLSDAGDDELRPISARCDPLLSVKTEAPVTDVLPRCTLALEGSETVDALVGRRMGR
jgi:hypothetical protein